MSEPGAISRNTVADDPEAPSFREGAFWAASPRLDRTDWLLAAGFVLVAFILRFFSPLMPDLFAHPLAGPPVSNCVQNTPIDARGTPGTLCGLAYPFQRGYSAQGQPPQPPEGEIFDEIYFGVFAHDDLKGISYFDPEPPLSKEIIAAGEWLWGWWKATFLGYSGSPADLGFDTFGWRIAACVFGSLCPGMIYLLGRRLMPEQRFFGFAASVLVTFDGMFFIQSRIGMIDIFPIFLVLLSYFAFMTHWRSRTPRAALLTLLLTGLCVSLAIAAKWISLAAWGTMLLFIAGRFVRPLIDLRFAAAGREWAWGRGDGPSIAGGSAFWPYLGVAVLAFAVLPAAIYIVSWFPFFERGQFHDLNDLWQYQVQTFEYHANLKAGHPYGSKWYTWPFLVRPVAYYFESQGLGVDQWTGRPLVGWMVNLGNPWIWWTSLPALVYSAYFAVRRRSLVAALIAMGFVAQYLPWARITRVIFLYHMFGGLVFMVLALAFALSRLAVTPRGRRVALGHLAVTVAFFAYFYPLWTGLPLGDNALLHGFPSGKAWLQSWI